MDTSDVWKTFQYVLLVWALDIWDGISTNEDVTECLTATAASFLISFDRMLTGSLLNAFISKYKLQAEFGVGFVSEDKFKSAVESLRSRKVRL